MMLAMGSRPIGILILCLASLLGMSCAGSTDSGELPPASAVQIYKGSWEYRYEDSPRKPDGTFTWADPASDSGPWEATTRLTNPLEPKPSNFLWLRTKLKPTAANTVFEIEHVYQSCEVYLDGRKVSWFGRVDGPRAAHFPGHRTVRIPIGASERDRWLVFRIYSPQPRIGIGPEPRLGEPPALVAALVRRGLSLIVMGLVFSIIAVLLLAVSLIRWGRPEYLLFSSCFLSAGVYLVCRSSMRSFLFEEPAVWYHIELGSLCVAMLFAIATQSNILGKKSLILRWSWRSFLLFFVGSVLLLLSGRAQLADLLGPLQKLILLATIGLTFATWFEIRRGNADARIIGMGLLISAVCITLQLLQLWGIINSVFYTAHYAAVAFLGSLGIILGRRFRAFNQRLMDYSTVLQLSFSSAQDLTPGHQAQIALTELLRILQAKRGLLFLCNPDGTGLILVAGRDTFSGALHSLPELVDHDQRLVDAVVQKRRPFVRTVLNPEAALGQKADKRSAVAAPLLARGQLLGVIYLEGGTSSSAFDREDVEILLGLASQIALTLVATRAGKLETESAEARQRLAEQEALLQAVARMAQGSLEHPIAVAPNSELSPLAQMLDQMRLDLRAKLELLETGNAAVRQLNEELRLQLDQRLRRALDFAQQRNQDATDGAAVRVSAAGFVAGQLLGEHYRIVRLLGEGSTGSVYEVEHSTNGRQLAVKVLSKRADRSAAVRFAREAQILARLNHPNIVSIVDIDLTADGMLFLVMELIRGTPLNHCLARFGEPRFALAVCRQIAASLRAVHEHGIIHRDLKPANVLVAGLDEDKGGRPLIKLVDFGISMPSLGRTASGEMSRSTCSTLGEMVFEPSLGFRAPDALVGTPMYLAPELAAGTQYAGSPADIFSFGIIAYEILSGEMPFSTPPVVSVWRGEALSFPPLRSKSRAAPLAESILQLVDQCLGLEPQQRPTAEQILTVFAAVPTTEPGGLEAGHRK